MGFAKLDLKNNVKVVKALDAAISSDTNTDGIVIDTKGYRSVTFVLSPFAYTDGTYTPVIQDGDASDLSDAAAVDDQHLIGTEAEAVIDADDEVVTIGYSGKNRFVRVRIASTSTSSGASLIGFAILGHPEDAPVSQGVGA